MVNLIIDFVRVIVLLKILLDFIFILYFDYFVVSGVSGYDLIYVVRERKLLKLKVRIIEY